jgi:hypothetical protein
MEYCRFFGIKDLVYYHNFHMHSHRDGWEREKRVIAGMALVAGILLTGCVPYPTPYVINNTGYQVMVGNVMAQTASKAQDIAEKECSKNNRHAIYVPDNVHDGIAFYKCEG